MIQEKKFVHEFKEKKIFKIYIVYFRQKFFTKLHYLRKNSTAMPYYIKKFFRKLLSLSISS